MRTSERRYLSALEVSGTTDREPNFIVDCRVILLACRFAALSLPHLFVGSYRKPVCVRSTERKDTVMPTIRPYVVCQPTAHLMTSWYGGAIHPCSGTRVAIRRSFHRPYARRVRLPTPPWHYLVAESQVSSTWSSTSWQCAGMVRAPIVPRQVRRSMR